MLRFKPLSFVVLAFLVPHVVRCQAQDISVADAKTFEIPADARLPGVGPMRRYDWFQNVWNQRRASFDKKTSSQQGAVVFLGDSITQGWRDDFSGAFPDLRKANRGISGDTTRGMLYRLKEDVMDVNPAAVVMLMGTNDLEENGTPDQVASNINAMVQGLKQHNQELPIVICEVFPSSASKKRPADQIKATNQMIRQTFRGDPQVTILDTWTLFADESGNAKKDEFPDLLHPNQKGYAKWASALRPIFATLGLIEKNTEPFKYEPEATVLFNGRDLSGWEFRPTTDKMRASRDRWIPRTNGEVTWPIVEQRQSFNRQKMTPDRRYQAIAGRLVVTTPPEGRKIQQLWTTQEFANDFQLKLEFRCTPNADSGVFLRGKQLQCRDYVLAGPYNDLEKYRPGEWNELVIDVRGTTAHCVCNGEVIEDEFKIPENGPLGLEGDRGQVEYRRIRMLPLQ